MQTILNVDGMMCTHCKDRVERICKAIPDVESVLVDLSAKTVTVLGHVDVDKLKQAISDADYTVVE